MRGRSRSRVVLRGALALALSSGLSLSVASAGPVMALSNAQISYRAIAMKTSATLCVGDKLEIDVAIRKSSVINGTTYDQWVTGGVIEAVIKNRQVGRFDPARNPAFGRIDASIANFVTFTFVAAAPGETEIDFNIKASGEEARGIVIGTGPNGVPAASFFTTIEVTECFDAYTSGLATVFVDKDMGPMTRFFLLTGHTPNAQVRTLSQFFMFIPSPQNPVGGSYAFVDLYWSTSAPGSRCTAYVSGHYDVVLYGTDPDRPIEGDLMMMGTGVSVCPRSSTPIDYTQSAGFQIGFKPRPTLPPGP